MNDENMFDKVHRNAVIIAAAFMGAFVVMAFVFEIVLKDLHLEVQPSIQSTLQYVLFAVALLEAISMVIIKNLILSGKINTKPFLNSQAFNSENERIGLQRLFSAFIIAYAIASSIGIYGFLFRLIGNDNALFYAFLGISLILMAIHFPRKDDWEVRLKNMEIDED